jgi:hypothetical protein
MLTRVLTWPWNSIRDYGWQVLTVLAVTGLSAESVLVGIPNHRLAWLHSVPGIVFLLCMAGAIAGSVDNISQTPRITALKREVSRLRQNEVRYKDALRQRQQDFKYILEGQLAVLATALNLGDTERISVFRYDEKCRRFHMLGRYSKSPQYREAGRDSYPAEEGCIGEAWRSGEGFVDHLPDPGTHFNDYCHSLAADWRMSQLTVQSLTMKSRSYAAYAIDNAMGDQRIAVIVFESTRVDSLDKDMLREAVKVQAKGLIYFLDRMRPLDPGLVHARTDYAREEGY